VNLKELAEKIEKKAGVEILGLPMGVKFMARTPEGSMALFKVGEPWPLKDGSIIVAMFQSEEEIRAYTLAAGEDGANAQPPSRHTISKHQPAIFSEVMNIDTFVDEVANEWVMVNEGVSTAERERAAVVAFLREFKDRKSNMTMFGLVGLNAADRIEAGDHLDDDEDDDDPEAVVPSAATPAAS
jgi:hypothetical protein